VARAHQEHHAQAFGYAESNVTFINGVIEDLESAGIVANSVDIIVSNCVINLSEDKAAVLAQAHRALKEGGEMYFSDVYSDRRIPGACGCCCVFLRLFSHFDEEAGRSHAIAYGECLGGALYWNDFKRLARKAGNSFALVLQARSHSLLRPILRFPRPKDGRLPGDRRSRCRASPGFRWCQVL
jgi:SAM-dependent methyltransferase